MCVCSCVSREKKKSATARAAVICLFFLVIYRREKWPRNKNKASPLGVRPDGAPISSSAQSRRGAKAYFSCNSTHSTHSTRLALLFVDWWICRRAWSSALYTVSSSSSYSYSCACKRLSGVVVLFFFFIMFSLRDSDFKNWKRKDKSQWSSALFVVCSCLHSNSPKCTS